MEMNVLAQQTVRSDQNIHIAPRHTRKRLCLLFWTAEARNHIHAHRKGTHPAECGLVMLQRKKRRRDQNRHLFATEHRFECGAESNLRLSVPDISAKQSVHRNRLLHIGLNIRNRVQLPLRFLIRKRILKIPLHGVIFRKSKSGLAESAGVQSDQLLRHIPDRRLHPLLCLSPFRSAQSGKLQHAVVSMRSNVF